MEVNPEFRKKTKRPHIELRTARNAGASHGWGIQLAEAQKARIAAILQVGVGV